MAFIVRYNMPSILYIRQLRVFVITLTVINQNRRRKKRANHHNAAPIDHYHVLQKYHSCCYCSFGCSFGSRCLCPRCETASGCESSFASSYWVRCRTHAPSVINVIAMHLCRSQRIFSDEKLEYRGDGIFRFVWRRGEGMCLQTSGLSPTV